ncbi:MAG: hypothetical protein AB1746_01630 [Candidatus Zixiibacteriota bacterium]
MCLVKRIIVFPSLILGLALVLTASGDGREFFGADDIMPPVGKYAADVPYVTVGVHNIGKIGLTITNQGSFGTGFINRDGNVNDPITGLRAPSCTYPFPGQQQYLFAGAFWIGAVVGRDTLASTGAEGWLYIREMWPDPYPMGEIIHRSISNHDDEEAVSEQDFIAVYTDTVTDPGYTGIDRIDGRPHIPLNIEVTQRSYAWSYAYADDFILFDYSIKNVGFREIKNAYMGIYVDGDVKVDGSQTGHDDDICGFRREIPSPTGCGFVDTIDIAWIADNDGRNDPAISCPGSFDATGVTGTRVVRTPSDSLRYSFNWWISNLDPSLDFGPRKAGTAEDPFRDFGGFLGTPLGDKNKYYMMRHEEFDYDQLFTAVDHTAEGWLPPPNDAVDFAKGYDTRYLLSFGPFNISPAEVLPITFAYVAGQGFHTECEAFQKKYSPYDPQEYYDYLDFTDLGTNAMWASWIYDNPGYDTDGDSLFGKNRICVYDSTVTYDTIQITPELIIDTIITYLDMDTLWYQGDGVPDFRGAAPPSPPELHVIPGIDEFSRGMLRVKWNGLTTENEKDIFSRKIDFEGYRVYVSLTPRASDFVVVSSFDIEDYNKYIWNRGRGLWELRDIPFTIDSLKKLYGNDFDPMEHDIDHIFYREDSAFYFTAQDYNESDLYDTTRIHKLYPDQPPPSTLDPDSAAVYFPDELTPKGLFKYYEYEYILDNILPSQLYYVSVTAFDFGAPASGLLSLESRPTMNMVAEYAQNQTSKIEEEGLNVIAYPNPYRIDGNYRGASGGFFEGRGQETMPDDRVRAIHFTNLPHKCTIRIFTIDGDLVREINHDYPPDSPQSMHDIWDVITRNTQAPVSGIYYYVVESDYGNQIGKLVLIM